MKQIERLRSLMAVTEADRDASVALAHALGISAEDFTSGAADILAQHLAGHRLDQVAGADSEAARQEELAKVYRQAQLTAEERLCREEANAKGWRRRCDHLEARAEAAERALAEAVKERDALRSASTIIRQRDEAEAAFRAAEHLCDRLRNIAAGKPVRDLEEAEAAFASARAFLTKRGEK